MQKTLFVFIFVLCSVLYSSIAKACSDPIPKWIFLIDTQTAKILPFKEAGCLETNCHYIYRLRSDEASKHNHVEISSKNGRGQLDWNSGKALTGLRGDFSMTSSNSSSIDKSKNLWLVPLEKITQIETGSLVKIWPEVYAEKQKLNSKRVVITNSNQITYDKLTVMGNEHSYFSCDKSKKILAYQSWRIEYYYPAQYCVPIPTFTLCKFTTDVPLFYLLIGAGFISVFLYECSQNKKAGQV